MSRTTHTEEFWVTAPVHILRCTAHLKSDGSRCRSEATPGTNVCRKHGALIPAVRHSAANRIQMSVDEAARYLVDLMGDDTVDVRERVKVAHDLLDRGGLGATSQVLLGTMRDDPIESLFRAIATDPHGLVDPNAPPPPRNPEVEVYNRTQLEHDDPDWEDEDLLGDLVVDDEVVEETPSPAREANGSHIPPRHMREALERAEALRELL